MLGWAPGFDGTREDPRGSQESHLFESGGQRSRDVDRRKNRRVNPGSGPKSRKHYQREQVQWSEEAPRMQPKVLFLRFQNLGHGGEAVK